MSRCPHCNKILKDNWVISQGAALMGKKGTKGRTPAQARKAARARWAKKDGKDGKAGSLTGKAAVPKTAD
jgi:hypothetical protein